MQRYHEVLLTRPVLHTPRLILRRPTKADAPAIIAIAGDWDVASRLAQVPHPYGQDEAGFFLDEIVPSSLVWAITDRTSRDILGVIGLNLDEASPETLAFGYYIAREKWGKGYATEAGAAVLAYGLGLVGAAHLSSSYFADNEKSGKVLAKLGFQKAGSFEQFCLAANTMKPSVRMLLPDTCI